MGSQNICKGRRVERHDLGFFFSVLCFVCGFELDFGEHMG